MIFFPTITRILVAWLLTILAGTVVAQQAYPSKAIRLIVPYPTGATNDNMARLVGQKLTESWGQQVLVDNRPGGSTIIGSEALVKSPPDGYSIMLISIDHVIIPQLLPAPYDPIKDFAPVATIAIGENVMLLHPSVPANNLREFIAFAKSRPGQLNYASSGSGTVSHLAGEMFNIMTGVKMQHIPYKGGAPAMTDLIGGQVHLQVNPPLPAIAHIKSGKLKAIAITGETRLPALPQVPTFTEAGLPGFDVNLWYGVFAPAGTPRAIVDKLSAEIARILGMPDVRDRQVSLGIRPFVSTPDQFAALIKVDFAKYAKIIKAASIKVD